MPHIARDDTYRRLPDGTLELIDSVEHVIPDDLITYREAPAVLSALLAKDRWTAGDLEVAVRALARLLLPPEPS